MLRLAVRFEESTKYFDLPKQRCSLGAAPDADLHLPLPGISRHHAEVEPHGRSLRLVDLGSKNGLLQGGQRHTEITLAPGDAVQIGRAWLRLEEVDSSDARLGLEFVADATHVAATVAPASATDSILSILDAHGDGEAALAALRWVRAAQGRGLDPADSHTTPLLEGAREVLAAESLFVLDRGVGAVEPALLLCVGSLPTEALLGEAAHEPGRQGQRARGLLPARCRPLDSERSLLASPAGETLVLAAVLAQPASRLRAWQRDFFEHLAERVRPSARRRGELPPGEPRPLALPAEFVLGESAAMRGLLASLQAASRSDLDVLLLGETGTGKEMVARTIHSSGTTAGGPFIAINCAAIPTDLLEAELFGVEARVATGVDPRPGLFLKAEGGSLFLDEIGDMPEPLQAKLLRALQEREVLPVGSHQPKKIRVRVISASNKSLPDLVRAGRFRADLFYRLRGLQFHLPPLRERRDDIPALVMAFASAAAVRYGKHLRGVSCKALALLVEHDWPGNVRELKSEVERAALLAADGHALESEQFAPIRWAIEQRARHGAGPWEREGNGHDQEPATPPQPAEKIASAAAMDERPLQARLDEVERAALEQALAAARGNKTEAARRLGITRNGLTMKMQRLSIR